MDLETLIAKREEAYRRMQEIKAHVREAKEVRQKIVEEMRPLREEKRKLQEEVSRLREEVQKGEAKIRIGRREYARRDIEKRIHRLEERVETEALPFDRERKLMEEIKHLQKLLHEFPEEEATREARVRLTKTQARLREVRDSLHALERANDEAHAKVVKLSEEYVRIRDEYARLKEEVQKRREEMRREEKKTKPSRQRRKKGKSSVLSLPADEKADAELEEKKRQVLEKLARKEKLTTEDLQILQMINEF